MDLAGTSVDPSTLQSELSVDNDNLAISGTLYNVTDFTAFSGDPELQSGNYMCVKFATVPADATVTIQMIGGAVVRNPVELDSDRNAILRVSDKDNQQLKVVASKTGYNTLTSVYSLTDLTFTNP